MKRTKNGTTTRLVDAAIQHLFTHGELKLLTQDELDHKDDTRRGKTEEQWNTMLKFVDPAAKKGNKAQDDFINRFMMRLQMEHADRYVLSIGLNFKTV